jgi:type IV pilus assembly protein PilB
LSNKQAVVPDSDVTVFANRIIASAIELKASDIHFEPHRHGMGVRYRIDGSLREATEVPEKMMSHMVARIKVMAELSTTGLPRPQEGNIKFEYKGEWEVDLRVSVFPNSYGECIVMRVLESVKLYEDFRQLGFLDYQASIIEEVVKRPYGLVLVTGPTGSGKSTTLFTMLDRLNSIERSLVTLEDPVERQMEGVRQTQVNPDVGLTFASGLRYLLRQDSDIIMVGEIRDEETAKIAIQAAITGQLVFSTIHTNNAIGAIIRLLNMGIEPFLITSALQMVTAQRLARRNCKYCKEEYRPPKELLRRINAAPDAVFYRSTGCAECQFKGISGRFGLHEVLPVNRKIEDVILSNPSEEAISAVAREKGMATLHDVAMEKAYEGEISLEEVFRLIE